MFTDTKNLQNPFYLTCEYGYSNVEVRQRFTLNAVIDSAWKVKGWAGLPCQRVGTGFDRPGQTGLPSSLVTSSSAPGGASGSINGSGGASRC